MAQEREESQGFYEMLWDCEFCDTKGLLAKSQRYCASCGGPQNPDKRYFPKEGEQVRVDGHKFEGADRTCPSCSSPMGAQAKNCTHCGSPLDGSAEVRGVVDAPGPVPGARPARPPRRRRRIWPFVLGAVAILGAVIWMRCIRTQEAQVVITGHHWQRVIGIEEFNDRQEEAWRNEVPADAGFPVCREKEHGSRQVADGEDCHTERKDKKDGTFEQVKKCKPKTRSEPVMDSWCRFTARRWKQVSELKAEGAGLAPAWPAGAPPADAPVLLGAKRQGKRTETLTLEFKDHGTCDVSDELWRKYKDGQKLKLEVHAGGDVACGAL